jgi:uncharacterized protein (DUF849 family)
MTAAAIAADSVRCVDAGAAIVHSHLPDMAVDAERAAASYLESWRPLLAARPEVIVYPTVGFGATVEERYAHGPLLADAGALRMSVVDPVGEPRRPAVRQHARDVAHQVALCDRYGSARASRSSSPASCGRRSTSAGAARCPRGRS